MPSSGFVRRIVVGRPPDCVLGLYNAALLIAVRTAVMRDAYFLSNEDTAIADSSRLRQFMIMVDEFGVVSDSQHKNWRTVIDQLAIHLKTENGYLTQWVEFKVLLRDSVYLVFEALKRSYNFKPPGGIINAQ